MAEEINIGDIRRVTGTWTVGGVPTDPTAVKLYVRKPDTTTAIENTYQGAATYVITRVSAGVFRADIPLDAAGIWRYEWEGTGAAQADEEGAFMVEPRRARG